MKRASFSALLIAVIALCLSAASVLAHQPYCEFADTTAEAPWLVPDPTISYAYFGNVYPAADIDYFRFEATAGQSVLISLSIPAIEGIDVYEPALVVFGPGLESDISKLLPAAIGIPPDQGARLIVLGAAPTYFYEPFGGVYFWNWADTFFEAPETAAYTVALWHPQDELGRYAFVIGQREVFGGEADCFSSYADYWTPLVAGENPYRDSPMMDGMMAHDHSGMIALDSDSAPAVNLQLIPLAGGGYNLRVQTLNFIFTPQNVDGAPVPGEGHAHLYLDGAKIARLYGEWYHLASLPPDAETLSVRLYANDPQRLHRRRRGDFGLGRAVGCPGSAPIVIEQLHPVTQRILDVLATAGCWYESFQHQPVRTSEEAARTRPGYSLRQGAKAIILRVKRTKRDKFFVMLVFPADRKFDSAAVKAYFKARDIRFASEAEVAALTDGVEPGGVPPFGNLFELPVYAAPELFEEERIVFNAGDRRFSLALRAEDYRHLARPTEFSFV